MHNQDVVFPNTNSWGGTCAVKSISAAIPQGASLKLGRRGRCRGNLDYIQIK